MTFFDDQNTKAAFMAKLATLDLNDLENGLKAMSVEAANIFPMISDDAEDDNGKGGAAYRQRMLAETIQRVDGENGAPALTLEHSILISPEGLIIDGRNRLSAILRNANALPLIDYAKIEGDTVGEQYMEILRTKVGAMDLLKAAAGDVAAPFNDADLIMRHLKVEHGTPAAQFDTIMRRNLARRDLTTSQRACVAANLSMAAFKRAGGGSKPKDTDIANSFGIGHKTMKRAKALKKDHADLFALCLSGKITVGKAEIYAAKREASDDQDDEGETKVKAPRAAAGAAKVTVYNEVALKSALLNADIAPAVLFDTLTEALGARFGNDSDEYAAFEAGLASLCGIELN